MNALQNQLSKINEEYTDRIKELLDLETFTSNNIEELKDLFRKINDYIDIQKGIIKLADILIKGLNFENDDDSDDDDSDDDSDDDDSDDDSDEMDSTEPKFSEDRFNEIKKEVSRMQPYCREKSNKHKVNVDTDRIKELQRCRNGEQQNLCFINADTDRIKELLDVKFFNKENIEEFENHLKTLIGYISLVKYLLNFK